MSNLSVDNIQDVGSSLIISIPNTKNKLPRKFVVTEEQDNMNFLTLYRKYAKLRPSDTNHRRFFLYYKSGKCTKQVVGKNTLAKVPNKVATFLNLPDAALYTGHCLRRSSATLLADAGADITTIKRHGGWRSTAVAESYIEDSIENKTTIANKVLQGTSTVKHVLKDTVNLNSNVNENYNFDVVPHSINLTSCENVTFNFTVNK